VVSLSQARATLTSLAKQRPSGRDARKYETICDLYDVIRDCRTTGHSWAVISKELKEKTGIVISGQTIMVNFKRITQERKTGKGDWE